MYFILIIVSLILGFLQGVKFKKKKLNLEIIKLEEENKHLTDKIEKMELQNHLSMYDVRAIKKSDKSVFQQYLVSYLSSKPAQELIHFYGFPNLISAIIKSSSAIDLQTQVDTNEFLKCSDQYIASIQRVENCDEFVVKVRINERIYELDLMDTMLKMNKDLFTSVNIKKYDLNYEELLSSIKIALSTVFMNIESSSIL